MTSKNKKITLTTIRFILGVIFLLSGVGKLIDTGYVNYELVRLLSTEFFWVIEYAAPIIITTSLIELIIAVFLFWGKKLVWAFSGALVMLLAFTSVLGYFYMQGMNVESCGCFGAFGIGSGLEFTLIRNLILIALTIGAYLLLAPPREALISE